MSIVTFYSYKGGSGRTTTMANVAVLLAKDKHKYKLACIDLDIAAPGLDVVFGINECLPEKFTFDFFKGLPVLLEEMYVDYADKRLNGKLYIFPAPRRHAEHERLGVIIDRMTTQGKLEALYEKIFDELNVDYILVDSRSGFADESTIHFIQSDKLFVVMKYADQHIVGTKKLMDVIEEIHSSIIETGKSREHFVVINDVPHDIPSDAEDALNKLGQEYNAVVIKENRELRWKDRIVVLDETFENEESRKQHEKLMSRYDEIASLITG